MDTQIAHTGSITVFYYNEARIRFNSKSRTVVELRLPRLKPQDEWQYSRRGNHFTPGVL